METHTTFLSNATTIEAAFDHAGSIMRAWGATGCTLRCIRFDEQGWPIGSREVPFRLNVDLDLVRINHDALGIAKA